MLYVLINDNIENKQINKSIQVENKSCFCLNISEVYLKSASSKQWKSTISP